MDIVNNKELRTLMAKACGLPDSQIKKWQKMEELRQKYRKLPRRDSFSGLEISNQIEKLEQDYEGDIPDYINDLNEMYKAEEKLCDHEVDVYDIYLEEIVAHRDDNSPTRRIKDRDYHATAKHKAIAFLKTKKNIMNNIITVICSCGYNLGVHKQDISEIAAGVWGPINCPECNKRLNEKIKELAGEDDESDI
jgi:hypothetical protein